MEQKPIHPAEVPGAPSAPNRHGLPFARRFGLASPRDSVPWRTRTARIIGAGGKVVFEQPDVEAPGPWSDQAVNVVAQKYFRGALGSPERESSVWSMITRVARTIADWGHADGYFASQGDALAFYDDLCWLLLHQRMAFNSPVWFNVGVEDDPQCSACFINSVDDSMSSILDLAKTEGMLFKNGSGTGTNLSTLRASTERLRGGGTASGPVSFMRGFDAFAGAVKSGGKTRRAAKMVILDVAHPDVVAFATCKRDEEKKAHALVDAGFSGDFDAAGGAYESLAFQNANHSVRVTDAFMQAAVCGGDWSTREVTTGAVAGVHRADQLLRTFAEAAWSCGDPGIQFHDAVNAWNPVADTQEIRASNPCSEYMFVDDSACNLASLNLLAFQDPAREFDTDAFFHAVRTTIVAMDVLVDRASYPTSKIARNSRVYRPLGLGYANLGTLLMATGIPYDSDEGRALAASVTALLGGAAYQVSAEVATARGAFAAYGDNRGSFLRTIEKHRSACYALRGDPEVQPVHGVLPPGKIQAAAEDAWDQAIRLGTQHGFRNAQATALAPTGTIAFLMDCDTTGVEPDLALVKYKTLVGGGQLKIANQSVSRALTRLGYRAVLDDVLAFLHEHGTIEGAPHLRPEHLAVFDCALPTAGGRRCVSAQGHLRMMAAVQPFVSGAISKTVNLPGDATADDVEHVFTDAWRMGLKAIAVYRDGCKRTQPMSTGPSAPPAPPEGDAGGLQRAALAVAEIAEHVGVRRDSIQVRETRVPAEIADWVDQAKRQILAHLAHLNRAPAAPQAALAGPPVANRHRLPVERAAVTHKFSVGGHEGYVTAGTYPDGQLGEIFVRMAKEGSVVAGLVDSFATAISLALQHGVPLSVLADKFRGTRFEPAGFTGNPEIPSATSVMDYLFRWLEKKFLQASTPQSLAVSAAPTTSGRDPKKPEVTRVPATVPRSWIRESDAPPCADCGTLMSRSGTCYRCDNCGSTSGCS